MKKWLFAAVLICFLTISLLIFPVYATTIDSYDVSNRDAGYNMKDLHPSDSGEDSAAGQTFTGDGKKITSATVYLWKSGSPTGTCYVKVYAHTGTWGSSGTPTGSALASSDGVDVATEVSGFFTGTTFTFSGDDQITLSDGTHYCIAFEMPTSGTVDADNYIQFGCDVSSPSHDGNIFHYANGAWVAIAVWDGCFIIVNGAAGETYNVDLTQSVSVGLNKQEQSTFNVPLTSSVSVAVSSLQHSVFNVVLSTSVTAGLDLLPQTVFNVILTLSNSIGLTLDVYITHIALIIVDLTLGVTASLNVLQQSVFNVLLSLPVANGLSLLPNSIFHVLLSISNTIGLTVDVWVYYVTTHIVDLTLNVSTSLSTYLLQGLQYFASLELPISIGLIMDIIHQLYEGITAEEAAAIGIIFAIIVLAVCIGLIYTRRRTEE